MASSIGSGNTDGRSDRAVHIPPWLLVPIGLGLYRFAAYLGDLWWLLGSLALLLDVIAVYVLLRLAERFPLGRRQPLRHLSPHAVAAAVFVATSIALQRTIGAIDPSPPASDTLVHLTIGELFSFFMWSGLAHAIMYVRRYRAAEADALRLRLDLAGAARKRAEAELRSFEHELNPRFLIGALRSAATHAQSDPIRGERLLIEIGDVVRAARPVSRAATLGDEIEALTPFLALEQERLSQEVVLASRVEDELLDEPLPPLVLSALVREALRTASGSGTIAIDISAARVTGPTGEQLRVDVSRAQQGPAQARAIGEDGVLARTIDHLRSAYAGEAAIDVTRTDGGVRVRLSVPLEREKPAVATAPAVYDTPPHIEPSTRSSGASPVVLTVCFVLLSALNINTALTRPRANGFIPPPALGITEALIAAASVTLMLYVAIRLTRREFGPRMLVVHASAAVGLGLFGSMIKWVFFTLAGDAYPPTTLKHALVRTVAAATIYSLFAGVIGAFEYARRHRSAKEKGLRLHAELAEAERRRIEAELRALKAELNPHFLGNALTGASSLMQADPAAARDVLTKLADVLGSVVARVGTQEVTLQEEIDSLASFVAVEQSRFGERLSVQWNVDEDARTARVPHLILQPLVENAVKHGLAAPQGGRIVVAGRRMGERLELTVRDNGVGLEQARRAPRTRPGGVGLANSRARLEQLYGGAATLQLAPAPGPEAGTIVTVMLPWR